MTGKKRQYYCVKQMHKHWTINYGEHPRRLELRRRIESVSLISLKFSFSARNSKLVW